MDAGLRAAFGDEAAPTTPSVLRLLQKKTGSRLDLHLDANDDSSLPVRIDDEARSLRDPAGRYQLLGEIGRGGVGIVYKGRDQDLGRDVAMKVLRPEHGSRPDILERFVEEAQIGGQLQHPGIVPVYELGLQQGERPYFAMKLVKGDTLATLLARRAGPAEDRHRFLAIFEQICQTLGYAHARRVVHRDLKPANVMIGSFGEVQVVDWGFAKVLQRREPKRADVQVSTEATSVIATLRSDPARGSQSVVGSTMGTPAYMPPEQALGDVDHMDERSDVFGLGGILCEILTGAPPYLERDGDLMQQAARCNLQGALQRLDGCGADAALVALCKLCLSPSRLARPATGKEVADAIAAHLSSVESRAHAAEIRAAEARGRARSTALLAAAAVLLLALGGVGYFVFTAQARSRHEQADRSVGNALREASVRLGEAQAPAADVAAWTRALDAVQQAEVLAQDPWVGDAQRTAVASLLATVREGRTAAVDAAAKLAADEALRQRLVDARTGLQEFVMRMGEVVDPAAARLQVAARYDEVYGRAFAESLAGRDLFALSTHEAVRVLGGPLAVEVAAALDDWATWPTQFRAVGVPVMTDRARQLQLLAMAIDPDPWRNRLRTMLGGGAFDREAVRALRREAEGAALPATSLQLFARVLQRVGDHAAVMPTMEAACERHPTDFLCAFDLGTLYLTTGQPERAEGCFRTARALRPGSALAHHNLSVAFRDRGLLGTALASARTAHALDPANPQVRNHLGNLLVQLGQVDDGIVHLRAAIAADPKFALPWNGLGIALLAKGETTEAAECFRTTIAMAPSFADAHHNLGDALIDLRRPHEAIASYRRALEFAPRDILTMNNLALTLDSVGESDEAMAVLRGVVAIDPNNGPANLNLGRFLERTGSLAEALVCWRRAEAAWRGAQDPFGRTWHQKVVPMIAAAEAQLGKQDELLALAREGRTSDDADDFVQAARLVRNRGDHPLAARTYERGFAAFPQLLTVRPHRYNAACEAALAGCGRGEPAAALADAERQRWREQARRWLAEEANVWRTALGGELKDARVARDAVQLALVDKDFAGVRDDAALRQLPSAEAEAWQQFWRELQQLATPR